MKEYKNEHAFRNDIAGVLRGMGAQATLIETRTRVGVPDMHVAFSGASWCVEFKMLKSINYRIGDTKSYRVTFKPGQQEWAAEYFAAKWDAVVLCVCFKNGVYVAPIGHIYYEAGIMPSNAFIGIPLDQAHKMYDFVQWSVL